MRLQLSSHARKRFAQRDLGESDVERMLRRP